MRIDGRTMATGAIAFAAVYLILHAAPAFAQSADPFATAKTAACNYQTSLKQFAGAVGMLGMVACLMLGYFNKLNWRWLSTCICVCFAINVVPGFVMGLAGGSCHS